MAVDYENSIPFRAALSLVLDGRVQKNGYTEAILRAHRREQKAASAD
jgi:malate synthase